MAKSVEASAQLQKSQSSGPSPLELAGFDPPVLPHAEHSVEGNSPVNYVVPSSDCKKISKENFNKEYPLEKVLRTAVERGEDTAGFLVYPVIERQDEQGRVVREHIPFPFKQLKELKEACSKYGPTAPFYIGHIRSHGRRCNASRGLEVSSTRLLVRR